MKRMWMDAAVDLRMALDKTRTHYRKKYISLPFLKPKDRFA